MKPQHKLVLFSILLAAFGITACDDDSTEDNSLCPTGKHVFGNSCEDDTLQNCGQHGYDCTSIIQGWAAGGCLNSACEATACTDGYHPYQNTCEPDDIGVCGSHETNCATTVTGWKSGTCTAGQCVATECTEGYHPYQNTCEPDDIATCGNHENDCATTVTGWKSGTCTKGQCVVSECLDGMSIDNNTCKYKAGDYFTGDYFTFGHYEQDNDTTNGKEAISWRVLDIKDGKCLIISEKALDVKPYNTTWTSITWEKSTIRSWLNGYDASYNTNKINYSSDNFIDTAFTADEKAKIVASNVPADTNPNYPEIDPGNATTDKIFLLSIVEAQKYFTSDTDRQAPVTAYTVEYNADYYTYNNVQYSYWWLRSPGNNNYSAPLVIRYGSIYDGGHDVDRDQIAVRPAMWVNL